MASIPCSIHTEFSSSSAAVGPWSRPSSPSPPPAPPPLGLCSSTRRLSTPFLGPTNTLGWLRRNSTMARTEVGVGGGGGGAHCCSTPRNSRIHAQIELQCTSRLSVRQQHFSKQVKFSVRNLSVIVSPLVLSSIGRESASIKWGRPLSAMDSNEVTSEDSPPSSMNSRDVIVEQTSIDSVNSDRAVSDTQLSSSDVQPTMRKTDKTTLETGEGTTKRTPLTAREKLRAARVLSKYTESRPSKSEPGSRVLDAIRESDRGKKRSGLPEAPSNLFDDSKRGLPKQGFTFNLPVGADILIIAFSFVFISTVMFATTYIVWKAGAIHFNEY